MLGVGILPTPSAPPLYLKPTTRNNPFCFSLLFQSKTRKKHLFFCPQLQHNLSSSLFLERTGFCLFVGKKQKDSSFSRIELERQDFEGGFEIDEKDGDEFDEGFDDGDEIDEDLDDDEDEDVMVPFDKMDAWLRKKPKGFGEGKVYDTSLEDKLLEELEKSRKDQLANIEKLKNEAQKLKKEVKVSEGVPGVVRVRINNLPKKMNIHRDLKSAFSGVHGIMNILPVVSGTKKTRDPICKGFAFVDFKSMEDADRFVQMFSGQNIAFGKTGKRIKGEILKSCNTNSEESLHEGYNSKSGSKEEGVQIDDIEENVLESVSWEEDDDEFDEDTHDTDIPYVRGNHKSSPVMDQDSSDDGVEPRVLQSLHPLLTKPKEKKTVKKKPVGKNKADNDSTLNVLPSGSWEEDDDNDDDEEFDEDFDEADLIGNYKSSKLTEHKSSHVAKSRVLQSLQPLTTKPKEKKTVKMKPVGKKKSDNNFELNVLQSGSWEDDVDDDEFDEDSSDTDAIVNHKSSSMMKQDSSDGAEPRVSHSLDSASTKLKVKKAVKKKPVGKKKPDDSSKLKVPGSAKRLKVQDKAKLADVYRRYGASQAVVSTEM